ncbi:MAG: tetraacyldisaccharide 4'-kinase [Bacteroidota bacterium]
MNILRKILYPVAFLYGIVISIRSALFSLRLLKSTSFKVPVIVVGNLSVGGTGKTPHIEYLIRLFKDKYNIATLSRGYGRKTKGYFIADSDSTSQMIGDEPLQFKHKFFDLPVTVCEKRVKGVEQILKDFINTEIILLDDAFQHRYVKPGLSILLTDFYQLYTKDHLLPVGNLREYRSGANRANIIIVTKTPIVLSPIEKRDILLQLKPKPHQSVYFSYITYGELKPIPSTTKIITVKPSSALLFTGIANSYPLEDHVKRTISAVQIMKFADHHEYTLQDLGTIKFEFERMMGSNKILITTEKDYMRLRNSEFQEFLASLPVFYIDIEIAFHGEDKEKFNHQILEYVRENLRNH